MITKKRKPTGPPKGHPGWGGRPKKIEMPCGWGCGALLAISEMQDHFSECPKRLLRMKAIEGKA